MRRVFWLAGILVMLSGLCAWVFWPLAPVEPIVSRQTSYLLGPLKPDGTVDYQSVIEKRLSEGVTRENNAAIPLLEALGPQSIDETSRPAVLEALGLSALPEEGKYLVPIEDHARARGLKASWQKAIEYQQLSEWLEENEEPLAKIVAASKRTRFYLPMATPSLSSKLDDVQTLRLDRSFVPASKALLVRASEKIKQQDCRGAWEDGRAVLRLGCLAAQYGKLLSDIYGDGLRNMACGIAFDIAKSGNLRAAEALRMAADFSNLPAIPAAMDLLNTERCMILDLSRVITTDARASIDPNIVSSEFNRWFDLWEGALAKRGYAAQAAEMETVGDQLKEEVEAAGGLFRRILPFMEGSSRRRRFLSTTIARTLTASMREKVTGAILRSRTDVAARCGLTVISLALAAWKADHGIFPESLKDLSPGCLGEVPLDPFTDRPFIYRRAGPGYVLYSTWWNMKDDGGGDRDMVLKVD